jgi:bifunctional ADP-heptose synthase (sugar kinase/adenylyltransferase)
MLLMKSAGKAMQRTDLAVLICTLDEEGLSIHAGLDLTGELPVQLALRSFDHNGASGDTVILTWAGISIGFLPILDMSWRKLGDYQT